LNGRSKHDSAASNVITTQKIPIENECFGLTEDSPDRKEKMGQKGA
jgi:hypothetical protein